MPNVEDAIRRADELPPIKPSETHPSLCAEFRNAYISALLWAEHDESGEPLDANYSEEDLAPEALEQIEADCAAFFNANATLLNDTNCLRYGPDFGPVVRAGHDFWLTRNGHGAGFWDGDWAEPVGEALTVAAKSFGECSPYVGDDGLIYL